MTEKEDVAMLENLKRRIRMYKRNLVSLDDLLGYLQAMHDCGFLTAEEVTYIVDCVISGDTRMLEDL